MRKINVKLFLGLLIGSLVCTGAVFAVHFFQSPRIARTLLWQAKRAEEASDAERTIRYLERYLEFNPRDLKERARLGSLLAGEQFASLPRRRMRGVNLLDDVITGEPERDDLRLILVKTALDLRNCQMAHGHLEKLWEAANAPEAKTTPDKLASLEFLWGRLCEGENKPQDAIKWYGYAIRDSKTELDSYIQLAFLLRSVADKDTVKGDDYRVDADKIIDQLVANNPQSYKSYLYRWRYRREFNLLGLSNKQEKGKILLAKAADDVASALQREPQKVEVLLAKADLERLLANAASDDTDQVNRERTVSEHRRIARATLEEGLRLQESAGNPDNSDPVLFQVLWHLVHLQFDEYPTDSKSEESARKSAQKTIEGTIERIAKTRAIPATVDYLKGRLMLVRSQWAAAVELLEKARPALAPQRELGAQIDLFLGQCYERLENPAQMYEAYKRVNEWDRTNVTAYLGMGAAQWMMGRLDDASQSFDVALKAERVPLQGWLDFARLEMQRQRQKTSQNWGATEDALNQAEKLDKKSVELTLMRAQLHYARNEADKAEALLRKAVSERPAEVEFWAALVELANRNKDIAKAARLLDEAEAKAGRKVLLLLARARLFAQEKDNKVAAEKINRLLDGMEKFSPEEQAQLLNGLGAAQFQANNVVDARKLWTRMCQLPRYQNDMRIRLLLFDVALQQGEGIQQALEDIRELEKGHGEFYRYGNALRLIQQAKANEQDRRPVLDEARRELEFARRQQPRWSAPCLALAEIDDLTGNPESSIKNLREAIEFGENSPSVVKRLVNALMSQNRVAEAKQEIERLQRLPQPDDDLVYMIAITKILDKSPSEAIKLIKGKTRKDSNDYREYLSKAWILAMADAKSEAEISLRKAVALAEKEPAPWIALVRFLAEQGRDAVAKTELEKARAKLPADKVNLTLAQCYEAMGLKNDAGKYYQKALDECGTDVMTVRTVASFLLRNGRLEDAKPLLKAIADGNPRANDVDREWARRGLAIVLSAGTDYRDFRVALDLVGVKMDENGLLVSDRDGNRWESTENLRAKARVLATQPQRQFRERALELLQDLRVRNALTPDDQFVLAILLDAQGAEAQSFQQIEALVRSQVDQPQFLAQGQTPQYLAKYVQMLLRQRSLDQAANWIERIEKLESQRGMRPNDYLSVELKARLFESRQEGDKALALLRAHNNRYSDKPENVLLIVASLGRQKKFSDALDTCEKAWRTTCPPEFLGGACVSLLREMKPSDEQLRRVEGWLTEAIRKRDRDSQANPKAPRNLALTMHLADLYDLRGQYEEAEKRYRDVVTAEPNNVVALNNLAWMLAQRHQKGAEAKSLIESAVKGVGRQPHLLDTRGLVNLALGETTAAVADFQEAIKDSPNPTRLFHLARAYHRAGDTDNAAKVLRQAAEQGLRPDKLHPVEQDACTKLMRELKVKVEQPVGAGA